MLNIDGTFNKLIIKLNSASLISISHQLIEILLIELVHIWILLASLCINLVQLVDISIDHLHIVNNTTINI